MNYGGHSCYSSWIILSKPLLSRKRALLFSTISYDFIENPFDQGDSYRISLSRRRAKKSLIHLSSSLYSKNEKTYNIPYRTKFCRTKFSTDRIFRRTELSVPSWNFDSFIRFLPDFCIEILDKIFDGQNFSSDKIFVTKSKLRQFCPTNFCPIRYLVFCIL